MPPKGTKSADKKTLAAVVRPPISKSSLIIIPEDVMPGFEERVETGIPWSPIEVAFRHHAANCRKDNLPIVTFHQAFYNKLESSVLGNLIKDSLLTLEEQVELLPMQAWDNEVFGSEEAKTCFQGINNITDNILLLIKEAVQKGDRKVIIERIIKGKTLRLIDCKMTELDNSLTEFNLLYLLNMACNYLETPQAELLPPNLKMLELQANRIKTIYCLTNIPKKLIYLGLSRNFLTNDCGLEVLRYSNISVLDVSDNDICELKPIIQALSELKQMCSLSLAGNPCAVCAGYAFYTIEKLPQLHWLDWRELPSEDQPHLTPPLSSADLPQTSSTVHPDDLRSAYFVFTCYRIMSLPVPHKPEKGVTINFHVELELPLLDSKRRQFLWYRNVGSLTELLPEPEDYYPTPSQSYSKHGSVKTKSKLHAEDTSMIVTESRMSTQLPEEEDIFAKLQPKNSRLIINYSVFESTHLPWSKVLTFPEPTLRIFCPDLVMLRNTFRTDVTIRVVFTQTTPAPKGGGAGGVKKGDTSKAQLEEQRLVLASVVCSLQAPDWSQKMQDFHWDDTMQTDRAVHCKDGELASIQYNLPGTKPLKQAKKETTDDINPANTPRPPPENLTCHFGFGIETIPLTSL